MICPVLAGLSRVRLGLPGSLWPTMEAARRDWVSTSANPKAPHDRAAWKQMIDAGGPRHLGIRFGEKQAKQRGQCMFGAPPVTPINDRTRASSLQCAYESRRQD